MRSMTGYGKAVYSENGINLTVELKTVNNRFLDLVPKYPKCFIALDDMIRKTVQANIKRGRVELFITYVNSSEAKQELSVDMATAQTYVDATKKLLARFDLENDFTLNSLMRCNGVLTEIPKSENMEELKTVLDKTLLGAIDNLNVMRDKEGGKLYDDLSNRVNVIESLVSSIKERAPLVAVDYKNKLCERIQEVLNDVKYDEQRLLQEVAIYTDKSNIDEELTRLNSHIHQFRQICLEKGETGKQLDFLIQEFNREANTVCSKSNDIEITRFALSLKNEIEKVREQIQNVE